VLVGAYSSRWVFGTVSSVADLREVRMLFVCYPQFSHLACVVERVPVGLVGCFSPRPFSMTWFAACRCLFFFDMVGG